MYTPQFPWCSDRGGHYIMEKFSCPEKEICVTPHFHYAMESCEGHYIMEIWAALRKKPVWPPHPVSLHHGKWGSIHHGKVGLPWERNLCDTPAPIFTENLCDPRERSLNDPCKSWTTLRKKPVSEQETCVTPWERSLCDPCKSWATLRETCVTPWERNLCDPP